MLHHDAVRRNQQYRIRQIKEVGDIVNTGGDVSIVIEPPKGLFRLNLRETWHYRELLYFLAWRDLKTRYAQTAIGIGWAIVQPLFTMLMFTLVFSRMANIPSDGLPYSVFALTALLPWGYMARSLERCSTSVVNEGALVRKVYFPRLIIPLAASVIGLVDFSVAFLFLLAMMAWYHIVPTWGILLLPMFLGLALLTALSVSLWLSATNVKYRDVASMVPLATQLWMFASPVVYPLSLVPDQWKFLYSLNPMVGVIEGFRWALLGNTRPDFDAMMLSAAVVFALFVGGVIYFRSVEDTFSDVI